MGVGDYKKIGKISFLQAQIAERKVWNSLCDRACDDDVSEKNDTLGKTPLNFDNICCLFPPDYRMFFVRTNAMAMNISFFFVSVSLMCSFFRYTLW